MDNQIIQQILNTQTQMLQRLTTLQQQQAINNIQPAQMNVSSPVTPLPAMSVADPTQYGTYANPYFGGGRPAVGAQFDPRNFITSSFNEAMTFNPAHQSVEASSMYMAQQAQGVQMGVVNGIGGALKGGVGIGSWFVPGIVPSLLGGAAASVVVGGIANQMASGARNANDYQNILQQKGPQFISAFNSTNDLGGIGWGLTDRQETSRFLRELAPSEYLSNGDMQKILSGAADNNLLKNVQDVKDFQKKFKDIVGAVKEITVTMNQTIDEATQFMGQMQQMGITSKDMSLVAAQSKVLGSTLGISAGQSSQFLLGSAQNLVQGTGMSAAGAIKNTAETTFYAQNLWNNLPNNSELKNLINNNGGPTGVASNFTQSIGGYVNSQQGTQYLAGLFGSAASIDANGNVSIDSNKLKSLLNGNQSASQLQQQSLGMINGLNPGQQAELVGKIGEQLTNMSGNDSTLFPAFAKRIAETYIQTAARSGTKMDMQQALVQSGLASNYNQAQIMEAMINNSTDPKLKAIFDARNIKQQDDAHAIANSPSIFQQAGYWFERNFEAPFANAGQNINDSIGQAMQGYQKWLTGMSDRSTVNATSLEDFSSKGIQKEFNRAKSINTSSQNMANYLMGRANDLSGTNVFASGQKAQDSLDIQSSIDRMNSSSRRNNNDPFNSGMYNLYMDQAWNGQLDSATLAKLHNQKKLGLMDGIRRTMVEQAATGQYDGIGGKINYALDEAGYGILSAGNWLLNHSPANAFGLGGSSTTSSNGKDTYKSLQTQQKQLEDEKKKLNQDTAALFISPGMKDLSETDLKNLQQKIATGDVAGVQSITSNKQAAELANRAKSLNGLDSHFTQAMGDFTNISQYTKAMANSGNLMADKFSAAGMDSNTINDLLSGIRSQGKSMSKNLKNMSLSDMKSQDQELLSKYDTIFASMPEYTKEQLVTYLKNQNNGFDAKKVMSPDGKSVNSNALENYLLQQINTENLAPSKSSSSKKQKASESDVVKASKDHTQAMYTVLTTLQQETQMMNDFSNGMPVTNYSSSLGTRGS